MQFCNEFPGSKYTLHLKVPKIAEFYARKLPIVAAKKKAVNYGKIFQNVRIIVCLFDSGFRQKDPLKEKLT